MYQSTPLFPITQAQEDQGHLTTDRARDIAMLQDINGTTKAATFYSHRLLDQPRISQLPEILSYVVMNDQEFAHTFPDELVSDYRNANGSHLPGYALDDAGQWTQVPHEQATADERRNYLRHHICEPAVRKMHSILSTRLNLDMIATVNPSCFGFAHQLANLTAYLNSAIA